MTGSQPEPLRCGSDLIGFVQYTGCDNYWMLGNFTPGPAFRKYRDLFVREGAYANFLDDVEDHDYLSYSDACMEALDRINDLELRLGEPDYGIRDFKLNQPFQVEFKIDRLA